MQEKVHVANQSYITRYVVLLVLYTESLLDILN